MGLLVGTKLGNYELGGPLGAGGMGELYRAKDLSLQRDVAADDHLFHTYSLGWLPDGKSFVFAGFENGHLQRLYVVGVDGKAPRPITPEGAGLGSVSPDGSQVATTMASGELVVFPINGSKPRAIPATSRKAPVVGWGRDGKSVFVLENREVPASILRVDIRTGKQQLWKKITPEEPSGAFFIAPVIIGPDESRMCTESTGGSPIYMWWKD